MLTGTIATREIQVGDVIRKRFWIERVHVLDVEIDADADIAWIAGLNLDNGNDLIRLRIDLDSEVFLVRQ